MIKTILILKKFELNHYELIERKTDIVIKQTIDVSEIQTCIDLFNSEIKWDGMFDIEEALFRIKNGEKMFIGYKNKQIFSYCWLRKDNEKEYYLYNVFCKKSKSLRKVGVIDMLYLVIKNHTNGKIKVEIDDWNTQSQKVAIGLGFNLIEDKNV